ncbi:MAG TPA: type II secretion system protein [Fimbriimonadaceae bacterium]|nr:type II secretion system protein [Fimbriimonadaceae bacterium]
MVAGIRGKTGRAFTLIELMVVVTIIAILISMMAPVVHSVKSAVKQSGAARGLSQLSMSTTLYLADNDDTFPLAMYTTEYGHWQTWFGMQVGQTDWDANQGILGPYRGNTTLKDSTLIAEPYIGDMSGFGYNYGYIGSDFHIRRDYGAWPNCRNAAHSSELASPSTTLIYTTTSFYNAPWLPDGDGATYDFGFVDPPEFWYGDPNMDFRHFGRRKVVEGKDEVTSEGRAIVVFADGNIRTVTQDQVKPDWFLRSGSAD